MKVKLMLNSTVSLILKLLFFIIIVSVVLQYDGYYYLMHVMGMVAITNCFIFIFFCIECTINMLFF